MAVQEVHLALEAAMAFLVAVVISRGQIVKHLQIDLDAEAAVAALCQMEAGKPEPLDTVA